MAGASRRCVLCHLNVAELLGAARNHHGAPKAQQKALSYLGLVGVLEEACKAQRCCGGH